MPLATHRPALPWLVRPLSALAVGTLALGMGAPAASADPAQPVFADTITVAGTGYGHGIGMSQYGAEGAARAGLAWTSILAFYYPGTTRAVLPAGNVMRVWISADGDAETSVVPQAGLRLVSDAGGTQALPTGASYTRWRMRVVGGVRVLESRSANGTWASRAVTLPKTAAWHFENPTAGYVQLMLPGGGVRDLRGKVTLRYDSRPRTVNTLPMEDYLKSVVPAEMPSSWRPNALAAQSVAARTFAARARALAGASAVYDTCETTNCQVYAGAATRSSANGPRTLREAAASNTAVATTKNQVLRYGSGFALTMFSSSNGGYRAPGGAPYLVAKADPYDGRVTNQAWTVPLARTTIERAYPTIGTLRSAQIVSRDGRGRWGGRAGTVRLVGSLRTVDVAGADFRFKFGLRSHLLNVTGGLKPGSPTYQRWVGSGTIKGWTGAPTTTERASRGFAEVRFENASMGWSAAGGAHYVNGPVRPLWDSLGGITSPLGAPATDLVAGPVAGSSKTLFTSGGIYYSASTGARAVYGPAHAAYVPAAARLGLPVASTSANSVGSVTRFQRGSITCTVSGACSVRVG